MVLRQFSIFNDHLSSPIHSHASFSLFTAVKHNGNITMDDVFEAARVMRERSMAVNFSGTVKEILGTATSIGCTVDGQAPQNIISKIDDGELEVPNE